jgi:hypothetical protein
MWRASIAGVDLLFDGCDHRVNPLADGDDLAEEVDALNVADDLEHLGAQAQLIALTAQIVTELSLWIDLHGPST